MKLTEARELNSKLIVVIMIILSKLAHSSSLSGNILGTRVLRLLIDTYTYSQIDWDRDRNIKLLDWDWVLCSILERDCARFDATMRYAKGSWKGNFEMMWTVPAETLLYQIILSMTEVSSTTVSVKLKKLSTQYDWVIRAGEDWLNKSKRSVDWEGRINWHRRSLRLKNRE